MGACRFRRPRAARFQRDIPCGIPAGAGALPISLTQRITMAEQTKLFDFDYADAFATAKERFGVWPTTIWTLDHQSILEKEMKKLIGDAGETRGGASKTTYHKIGKSTHLSDTTGTYTSIFSPSIAAWIINMFARNATKVFDPFAGGGTRAIMCAAAGLDYTGIELRDDEVSATRSRISMAGMEARARIICADSAGLNGLIDDASSDFLITCPPYWNMEQYKGGARDLSMAPSYGIFCEMLGNVINHTARILRHGSTSAWVVGLHRDKEGGLITMHHDVASLHKRNGFIQREEIIIRHTGNGSIQRVGSFDRGRHLLVRDHEYVLIFDRK